MEFTLTPTAAQTLVTLDEYTLGVFYAETAQVDIERREVMPSLTRIVGTVRGIDVNVELEMVDGNINFGSYCAKHRGEQSCADIAAMLIDVTNDAEGFSVSDEVLTADMLEWGSRSSWQKPKVAHWERTLDRLLPVADDLSAPVPEEPLGLILKVTSEPRYGASEALTVLARPVRRGTKSPWVQTGVSWRTVGFDERFSRVQRQAVMELDRLRELAERREYGHAWNADDWISIMDLPGRELLETFTALREADVQIVNGGTAAKNPVDFSSVPARAYVDVRRGESALTLEGTLLGPTPEHTHLLPVGNPPTLLAYASSPLPKAKDLGLAEFDRPVSAELANFIAAGAQAIPVDDIDKFENGMLDRVRYLAPLRSSNDSYTPPPLPRPELILTLDTSRAPLRTEFAWRYSRAGIRQRELEQEIIASVEDKLGGEHPMGVPTAQNLFPARTFTASESIDFLMYTLPLLEEHPDIVVHSEESVPDYKLNNAPATISIEAGESTTDWFDLSVEVMIDGLKVPFAQLLAALTAEEDYLVLDDLTVIPIGGDEFRQLRQLVHEAGELGRVADDTIRIHKLSIDWWQELVNLGIIEAQQNQWLQTMAELSVQDRLQPVQLPKTFTAALRPYQEQGLSWLNFLRTHSLGGVLADDMGLGKTVQLLACLEKARTENPEQKFLVVAPTSVVGNWVNEAQRFAPEMSTVAVTSTAKKSGQSILEQIGQAQLIVTSYTIFRLSFEEFEQAGFSVMIMDEAQMLKNHASKGYKQARQLEVPCKFVVTGTPMENNLLELWSLVSLAAPGLLGGLKSFKDIYQKPITDGESERLNRLKKRLRPFVLRRTKEQVVPELPEKTEQVLEVELEPAHRRAYDRRFQRVRQEILGLVDDDVDSNRFKILQSLTLLRQLALDPSLVDEGNAPSAKLEMLRELMEDAVAEGHKILVFSQFTGFLSKARDVANELGVEHGYLDGTTSGPKRKQMIDGFTAGDFQVFFISLKSGGFGINLTAADYCVLLDPWWNPAAEAQAIDRAHRIGQTRPVHVYRLVSKDTIESKVLALQAKKTQLFNDVLGEDSDSVQSGALSAEDFLALMQ